MAKPFDQKKLYDAARAVLATNDMGDWTRPTPNGLYPHQWLWDSFFIAIGQRHYDVERAKAEVRSPFRAQWKNGMLPHIIFSDAKGYHAGPELWHCEVSPNSPDDVETSGVTQPPMAAEAVVRIGELLSREERQKWYAEMYPRLVSYHEWLYRERDVDGDGLVTVLLSWETGMDNLPPWMKLMHEQAVSPRVQRMKRLGLDKTAEAKRKDTKVVPAEERISTIDLHAVYDLIKELRRLKYDSQAIMKSYPMQIADLTFNCILMRANEHLRDIAAELGQPLPEAVSTAIERAPQALESLWDEETSHYYCRDERSGELIRVPSVNTFLPLYAQVLPPKRVQQLMALLHDPDTYGLPYPVPSTPRSSTYFDPRRYWQGPTWVDVNWLVADGLERNDQRTEAVHLRQRTLEMVARSGMHEYFSPLDAAKAGAGSFSWTAALVIDLLEDEELLTT